MIPSICIVATIDIFWNEKAWAGPRADAPHRDVRGELEQVRAAASRGNGEDWADNDA